MPNLKAVAPSVVAEAQNELARRRLARFAGRVYPGFMARRHHLALTDALERVENGTCRRLIIQMPPRHGKSTIASQIFPPWYLGRNPNRRIIACSYSVDLAYPFSRQARAMMTVPEYAEIFPNVTVAGDSRSVAQWDLAAPHTGGYVAAGVGGGITGKGAHIVLIDDPVKNQEEASSAKVLQGIWEWYTSTLYTRLEGVGAIVVIMTRWAENDLAGLLQASSSAEGDRWEVLNLPAIAEESDAIGREPGDALWPDKFSESDLARIQVVEGPQHFAALYQQRPSPASGFLFNRDWWKRYRAFDRAQARQVIQVWDTAFQVKTTADYSVCTTWALTDHGAYVLDMFRDRVEYPALKRKARDLAAKWRPVAILIENKASGQSLIQDLQADSALPIIAIGTDTDKVTRATAVTGYVEAGRVYLPDDAPWADVFIEEHASFPNGAHDDIVDTSSMALKRLFIDTPTFGQADVQAAVVERPPADWLFGE